MHAHGRSAVGQGRTPSLRLFYAIWPEDAARTALAELATRVVERAGGRATVTANLHLTVVFLGTVAEERLALVADAGEHAASTCMPFALTLDRLGGFRDAGVAWVGTATAPPELAALVAALREALNAGGVVTEVRAFRAHVTLARRCERPVRETLRVPITWPVRELTLVASTLASGGSRYDIVRRWPLKSLAGTRT